MIKPPPLELHGTVPLEDQFDTVERLHTICDHLRTGRFGQREAWEEWLMAAAADIKRLTSERNDYEAEGRRHIKTIAELRHDLRIVGLVDIIRLLRIEVERLQAVVKAHEADNELRYFGEIPL